ncbi:MAG: (deoxy)nucleoside triphosphate pyrophosphohydrolase [Bacteroidota bacterium]
MIQVAVGIVERDGHILVCQRKRGSRYELKWEFPGGKVENGENLEISLKRELSEELSITADVGEEIFQQRWIYPDRGEFELHFFTVQKFSGEPKNQAFEQILWVSPQDLNKLNLLEGSKAVIRHITGSSRG